MGDPGESARKRSKGQQDDTNWWSTPLDVEDPIGSNRGPMVDVFLRHVGLDPTKGSKGQQDEGRPQVPPIRDLLQEALSRRG